ncbi:unnamed protein product [Taenia asiatica]|uniref:BACK domain-containing protein n=1 Tax=Taenia asiatica TaxID=60517 RepID=A0A0R3WH44_TAEAS|nr:unnamed protein product [Taenia asiatica]
MMLESKQLKGVSEETKFRAIRNWLDAGISECDLEEKAKIFAKMISRIELTRLSPQCQSEYWAFVWGYSDQFIGVAASPNRRMQPDGNAARQMFRPVSNCPPSSKEVLMIYGFNRVSKSWCLTSVPQLQPEESFNVKVPSGGTPTVLDGRVCLVVCDDSECSVMSVNYRDGSISYKSFTAKRRRHYAVASRNESIFIFGGYYNGEYMSTCEKLDIASGESAEVLVEDPRNESGWRWIRLNPMLEARHRPGVAHFRGCVVVAGGDEELSTEYLPLTSIKQTNAQWTRLRGINKLHSFPTTLALFNNRLIMLVSYDVRSDAYEFLPTEEVNK